jgi:hypothetical protein
MLNTVLGCLAVVVWSTAYGLYFVHDIVRLRRTRHLREALRAAQRAEAVRAYAAWIRDYPPLVPSRRAIMPVAVPAAAPPPRRGGVVVPFPGRSVRRR